MSSDLPILNYEFAINQLGGNEVLLKKMLGKFVSEYKELSNEIVNIINNNDLESAKMKVHSVKGISGNLGLQALYDCSSKFDAELRSGECSQALLSKFVALLVNTCSEIDRMEQQDKPEHQIAETTMSFQESKDELIKRLDRNEFIDDDKLMHLISGLGLIEADAKNLVQLIEELQYPKAIKLIEQHT